MHSLYQRFGGLAGESMRFELQERGGEITVLVQGAGDPPLAPVLEDYRVTRLLSLGRQALGRLRYAPSAVLFTYARPRVLAPYARVFGQGVPMEFEQSLAGLRVPSALFDEPLAGADPVLHRILVHNIEALPRASIGASLRRFVYTRWR